MNLNVSSRCIYEIIKAINKPRAVAKNQKPKNRIDTRKIVKFAI